MSIHSEIMKIVGNHIYNVETSIERTDTQFKRGQMDALKSIKLWWLENKEYLERQEELQQRQADSVYIKLMPLLFEIRDLMDTDFILDEGGTILLRLTTFASCGIVDPERKDVIRAFNKINKEDTYIVDDQLYRCTNIIVKDYPTQQRISHEYIFDPIN